MLGIPDIIRGKVANGLQLSSDMLHISANIAEVTSRIIHGVYHTDKCELIKDITRDTLRTPELIWQNRGMIKNLPAALENTIEHIKGEREIDHSIDPNAPNAMMLPGILSGVRSYYSLLVALKTHNINIVESPHLPEYLRALFKIESAEETARNGLEYIYNSDIEGLVHPIGHSHGTLGALMMKVLDDEQPGPNRIGQVINIAGPHEGTEKVRMFRLNQFIDIFADMDPNSPLIKKVRENAHYMINIIAANDDLVLPEEQKTSGVQKEIELDMGHLDIPFGSDEDTQKLGSIIAQEIHAA